ncbi:glutathione peroxidase [Carboxylicivirga taeanensis]|uniref:glutathione peroxidase n=1 Tax=Carboxylicivirga taeanensis TaxID=1416875 RepID=UPI003F6DD195
MKLTIAFLTFFLMLNMTTFGQDSFYDFEVTTIEGEPFKLAELKGKKVMVVNVASKCGLTPQYEQLQKVYDMYGGEDFTIIGFPANNFLSQEPGSNEEIQGFCQKNYGVTFLMMSKISVKGDDIHPLYEWLTSGSLNNFGDSKVKWNFQKYLINRNGEIEKVIPPKTLPDDKEVIDWIIN